MLLFQSGPFMSTSVLSDPSGTGFNISVILRSRRASRHRTGRESVRGPIHQPVDQPQRFRRSCANACQNGPLSAASATRHRIHRRPGTQAVSLSLIKRFTIKERVRAEIGMQVANAFNHPNYAPPAL